MTENGRRFRHAETEITPLSAFRASAGALKRYSLRMCLYVFQIEMFYAGIKIRYVWMCFVYCDASEVCVGCVPFCALFVDTYFN